MTEKKICVCVLARARAGALDLFLSIWTAVGRRMRSRPLRRVGISSGVCSMFVAFFDCVCVCGVVFTWRNASTTCGRSLSWMQAPTITTTNPCNLPSYIQSLGVEQDHPCLQTPKRGPFESYFGQTPSVADHADSFEAVGATSRAAQHR